MIQIQKPLNFKNVFCTLAFFFFLKKKVKFYTPTIKKSTNNHSELDYVNQHIINKVFFFLKDSQLIYDYLLVFLKMSLGHIKIT